MNTHITPRGTVALALGVLALSVAALALPGAAGAFIGYGTPTYFGAEGSGNGQFAEPAGVAVNDVTHDVYVYDAGNRRVQWFGALGGKFEGQFDGSASPTGQFAPPATISEHAAHGTLFNLAVDNDPSSPSTGDLYVVDPGNDVVDKFSADGKYVSQLTGFHAPIFGVAVDDRGHVWVAEEGSEAGGNHGPIQEFDSAPENKHLGELSPEFLRSPGIAVDSEEHLYLIKGEPNVAKFDQNGAVIEEQLTNCGCLTGLAIDPGNDDLFADQGNLIARYGPFGEPYRLAQETLAGVSGSRGIAVDGATHTVYASQREANSVAVFTFGLLPDVSTGAASEVHRTSAKLEGEVDPDGQEVTSCEFEYGTGEAYGHTIACATAPGSGSNQVAVSAEPAGLTAQTTYHYRLVAGNTNGQHTGADRELTTPPAVENLLTEGAVAVTGTAATLQGSLEPNGFDTHFRFEYHAIGAPASSTPLQDAGSASEDEHLDAEISGLKPNAFYIYQILGENEFGQSAGEIRLFRTKVLAPLVPGAPSATFVAAQSADVSAALNPQNTTTHYHFEYGPCPNLAGCAEIQSTPSETSEVDAEIAASAEIAGLAPATTYSYRLVAVNEFEESGEPRQDTTNGAEDTFTTGPAAIPAVQTGAYEALAPTGAVISGIVEPHGVPASYVFELGVYNGAATQYGIVLSGSAGTSAVPVPASVQLTGLQPGTSYAYRLSVSSGYILNASHSLQGVTITFTTPGLPAAIAAPSLLAILPVPAIQLPGEPAATAKCKTGYRRDEHDGKCVRAKAKQRKKGRRAHKGKVTKGKR